MCIQVTVNSPLGREKLLKVCDTHEQLMKMKGLEFKRRISEGLGTGDDLRIIHNSTPLEDETPLESTGIKHMSTIDTVLRVNGGI